jgi:hypothetical protein
VTEGQKCREMWEHGGGRGAVTHGRDGTYVIYMLSYISDINAYLLYNCCKHSPPVNMLYNFISHLRSYYRWISVFDIYPPSPSFSYFYSCLYKVNDPGYNNSPVNMLYNYISHLRSYYRWISIFVIYPLSLSLFIYIFLLLFIQGQ